MSPLRRTDGSLGFVETLAPDFSELIRKVLLECTQHGSCQRQCQCQLVVSINQWPIVSAGHLNRPVKKVYLFGNGSSAFR
jgi:hypothetical protein